MNLNINSAAQSYNSKNCQNPSFGMAVKMDENVIPVIKKQAMKLGQKKYDGFWKQIDKTVERQSENPVNIILRKARGRNAITAVVVDEKAENAVKNQKFSQGLLSRNGSLSFLKKSEACADKINEINTKVAGYEKAIKTDYKPAEPVFEIEI